MDPITAEPVRSESEASLAAPAAAGACAAVPEEPEIEVFRAGDYGPRGRFTPDDLEQLAADYNPALLEAPLTLDHAQSGPAHGWVAAVQRTGDRLKARLRGLSEDVRRLVASGAFRRCSIEVVRRLPSTGRPYLRAVSLLGAASPAVDGLAPVQFSATLLGDPAPDAAAFSVVSPEDNSTQLREEVAALRRERFVLRADALLTRARHDGLPLPADAAERLADVVGFSAGGATTFSAPYAQQENALLTWLGDLLTRAACAVPQGQISAPVLRPPVALPTGPPSASDGAAHFARQGEGIASDDPAERSRRLHQSALLLQSGDATLSYARALALAARMQS